MSERAPQPEMLMEVAGLTDSELLTLFIDHRDESAFSELVQRYRRLVWSVCRRVLADAHDIEDVFQATFLVLVRDAVRIRRRPSVASWLYGVAYRLAVRVRRQADRRREVESLTSDPVANDDFATMAQMFVRQTVDEELHSLPNKYRQPLVLHYLTGKSQKDVAAEMGLTEGAVDGLLKRGRHALRMRLYRRGVTLGAVWIVLNWTEQAAQAAPLVPLTQTTVQAGLAFSAGKTAGAVSAAVMTLTGKELMTMSLLTKPMTSVAATICVLGLAAGGTNWLLGSNQPARKSASSLNSSVSPRHSQAIVLSNDSALESNLITLASADSPDAGSFRPPAATPETNLSEYEGRFWHFQERSKDVEKIDAELRKQTDVDFQDQPLTDVMTFLSDFHNIPVIIDHEALTEAKIKTDTPITRTLTGVKLESALNLILTPLKLDYVIDNDVMMITTAKQAEATTEALVYDLARIPNIEPKTLSSIIMSVTKPEAWTEKGGPGSLTLGDDFIVVNQNQRSHRKIVSLLNQLERHAKEQVRRRAAKPAPR